MKLLVMVLVLLSNIIWAATPTQSYQHMDGLKVGPKTFAPSSALVDMDSTTLGVLLPRVTTTQMNAIVSPVGGLLVFNTTLQTVMEYNSNTFAWTFLVASSGGAALNPSISVITDSLGNLTSSATTSTELGYVHGVTSSIQTQLDSKINKNGSTFLTGNWDIGGFKITNLLTPTNSSDAVTKNYVDTSVANTAFVRVNGTTPLTGNWDTGGVFKITNVATPTNSSDAVNKNYVDTAAGVVRSLNAQTGVTQVFANDANVGVSSASNTHTLTWTGQLAINRGGTNASTALGAINNISPLTTLGDTLYFDGTNNLRLGGNTTATKKYLSQTGTGTVSAAPSWLQPACADLSNAAASCSTDATNANNISTGTVATARGGTGASLTPSIGGLLFGTTTSAFALTAVGTAGQVLHGAGASSPTWGAVALTADVSGTLPIANGGTGASLTGSAGGVPYFSSTSAMAVLAAGTSGQVFASGGTGAPTWVNDLRQDGSTKLTANWDIGAFNIKNVGALVYAGATSGNVTVQASGAAGTWTWKWPTSAGTSGQVLQTDGTGVTSWTAAAAGGGGATYMGMAYIAGTTSCLWTTTSTSLAAFSTVAACPGPTVFLTQGAGTIQTTDTDLPKFTVNSLPAGTCVVKISGTTGASSAESIFAINDGTNTSPGIESDNVSNTTQFTAMGMFHYAGSGNVTFSLYGANGGAGTVTVYDNAAARNLVFEIYCY